MTRILQIEVIFAEFIKATKEARKHEGLSSIEIELEKKQVEIIISIVEELQKELDYQKIEMNRTLKEISASNISETNFRIDELQSDLNGVRFLIKYFVIIYHFNLLC